MNLEDIKDKINIKHVKDTGIRDALILRLRSYINKPCFIANFNETIKNKSSNTLYNTEDKTLYIWEYDVVTVKKEYIKNKNEIINAYVKKLKK